MKLRMMTTLVLLTISNLSFAYQTTGRESGGGDVLVMNFQMAGQRVCDYLKTAATADRYGLDPARFCESVEKVKVTSEEKTHLEDGTEVDAINIPSESKIILSLDRNFSKDLKQLIQLAAHEYISVQGLDDRNYKISGPLTMKIEAPDDVTSPPAACMAINANYQCQDQRNRKLTITSSGNVFKMEGIHYARKPFTADGQERLVDYVPAGTDRDIPYEAYLKAQCVDSGFELQTRNNDFAGSGKNDGKYVQMGYSQEFYALKVKPDQTAISIYHRHRKIDFATGTVSETKNRFQCTRIDP